MFPNGTIVIWLNASLSPTSTIPNNCTRSFTPFVSMAGDIYLSFGPPDRRVGVCRESTNSCVSILYSTDECYGLFIDSNASLYCSLLYGHVVIKRSLNSSDFQVAVVAGAGCPGYLPHMLFSPHGIFVSINFDLHVADSQNDRIQLFQQGHVNGTMVAGRWAPGTVELLNPTAVVLDADGYLFIVDCNNNRIVASGSTGFRCVIGCTNGYGSASTQLAFPQSMAFDSYGNIFVADTYNSRVQKFLLMTNSCGT